MPDSAYDDWLPLTPRVFHILLALVDGAQHGYAVMQEVDERSRGRVQIGPGTLYEAIHGLREKALVTEVTAPRGTDRRRRYYDLTPMGRGVLEAETARLTDLVDFARAKQALGETP